MKKVWVLSVLFGCVASLSSVLAADNDCFCVPWMEGVSFSVLKASTWSLQEVQEHLQLMTTFDAYLSRRMIFQLFLTDISKSYILQQEHVYTLLTKPLVEGIKGECPPLIIAAIVYYAVRRLWAVFEGKKWENPFNDERFSKLERWCNDPRCACCGGKTRGDDIAYVLVCGCICNSSCLKKAFFDKRSGIVDCERCHQATEVVLES